MTSGAPASMVRLALPSGLTAWHCLDCAPAATFHGWTLADDAPDPDPRDECAGCQAGRASLDAFEAAFRAPMSPDEMRHRDAASGANRARKRGPNRANFRHSKHVKSGYENRS